MSSPEAALDQREPRRSRSTLAGNACLGLLAMAIVLCNASVPQSIARTDLDESWSQALHQAYVRGMRCGVDYVFTCGPLGFLVTGSYQKETIAALVTWNLLTAYGLALIVCECIRRARHASAKIGLALFALCLPVIGGGWEARPLFLSTGAAFLLLDQCRPRTAQLAPFYLYLVLLSLTKTTFLIMAFTQGLIVLTWIGVRHGWKWSASIAVCVGVLYVGAWLGCGQPLSTWPDYVASSLEVVRHYNDGMSMPPLLGELAFAGLLSLLLIAANGIEAGWPSFSGSGSAQLLLILWTTFQAFKYGFGRADISHTNAYFLTAAALAGLSFSRNVRNRVTAPLLVAVLMISFYALAPTSMEGKWSLPFEWARVVRNNARALSPPWDLVARNESKRAEYAATHRLPDIAEEIGDAPVDLLTEQLGVLFLNGFNWHPRPVIQSHLTCSPMLMEMNRRFFAGPDAPAYVILKWETIDGRFPSLDDGAALIEIMHSYQPLFTEKGYLLMRKRPIVDAAESPPCLLDDTIALGSSLNLEKLGSGPKALVVTFEKRPMGKVRSLLYQGAYARIEATFGDGTTKDYRLIPGMIQQPVLVDPLWRNAAEFNRAIQLDWLGLAPKSMRIWTERPRYFGATVRVQVLDLSGVIGRPKLANDE